MIGSFGQFCPAQDPQVMPKSAHLTWEEAGIGAAGNRVALVGAPDRGFGRTRRAA
jgi:hypothetical protein